MVPVSPRLLTEPRVLGGTTRPTTFSSRAELQLAFRGERDPRSHQGFGSQGQDHQACYTPCDAPFLRDRSTGSRGGHSDDQSLAGPRQLYDHDDLSELVHVSPVFGAA